VIAADPLAWRQLANCRGVDPELFFPERGEPAADAKAVCLGCVVRTECLEHALAHERFGIWGGTSERERRDIRRQRRRAVAAGDIRTPSHTHRRPHP
jgi:WhiB family redox-sensing transcriptional regulator